MLRKYEGLYCIMIFCAATRAIFIFSIISISHSWGSLTKHRTGYEVFCSLVSSVRVVQAWKYLLITFAWNFCQEPLRLTALEHWEFWISLNRVNNLAPIILLISHIILRYLISASVHYKWVVIASKQVKSKQEFVCSSVLEFLPRHDSCFHNTINKPRFSS